MNWSLPGTWRLIHATARSVGYPWSPTEIVRRLKQLDPGLFATLRPQRISDWRDNTVFDRLTWKANVLAAVSHGNKPHGMVTRSHILVCPLSSSC